MEIFRGLNFESDAEIGQNYHLWIDAYQNRFQTFNQVEGRGGAGSSTGGIYVIF
jgi:hypothetical protein